MLSCDLATASAGFCRQSRHQFSWLSFRSPPRSFSLATLSKSENRTSRCFAGIGTCSWRLAEPLAPLPGAAGFSGAEARCQQCDTWRASWFGSSCVHASANWSPALSASRGGMHMPSRNTCRARIHSSAHATSTPPRLSRPTVPSGASTHVPVKRALRIPRCRMATLGPRNTQG